MQQSSLLAVRYRWGSRHLVGSAGMLLWEYQAMVDPYSGLKCAWVDCGDEGVVAMGLGWFVLERTVGCVESNTSEDMRRKRTGLRLDRRLPLKRERASS